MLIERLEEELKVKKRRRRNIFLLFSVLGVLVLIFGKYKWFFTEETILQENKKEKIEEVVIFHPDRNLRFTKTVLKMENIAHERTKIDSILKTLKELKTIPENLTIYEYTVDEKGTLFVNFSNQLIKEIKEPKKEIIAVFSLVNSLLANIQNAKSVQLLIEGEPVYTLGGLIYTYRPLTFNEQLMED